MDFHRHGGALDAARRTWPDAPQPWIDLSTGINPIPYPARPASRAARGRLPLREETAALEEAAAATFGVEPEQVAAVAGAEAALRLLPWLLGKRSVHVAGPTYASHADAWTSAGASLVDSAAEAEIVIIVSPDNPDGRIASRADLLALADGLATREGWLIVDESFADAEDGRSIAAANHPRIIALRSFGKFYGLAGVRLGFVLGDPTLLAQVRAATGDWPVSADAIAAAINAYSDRCWIERTRTRLAQSAAWLDRRLIDAGFERVGGTALFRLVRAADAPRRFAALCAQGVLTRPFSYDPTWLRFGLPHPSARPRVAAALEGPPWESLR